MTTTDTNTTQARPRLRYRVTIASTGRQVRPGELITDWNGRDAVFTKVLRGPAHGKSAKVAVRELDGTPGSYYAHVFGLAVTETTRVS